MKLNPRLLGIHLEEISLPERAKPLWPRTLLLGILVFEIVLAGVIVGLLT